MTIGEIMEAFDSKKREHIVIRIEDFVKYVNNGMKAALLENDLQDIRAGRKADGKEPEPRYIVVEASAPYAGEIIEILRRNGAW